MIEIYNENCLEGMKKIPDGSVDAIICDPPYGTTDCYFDKRLPFEPMWEQFLRVTKQNAAIVLFCQMPFGSDLIQSQRSLYRYEWIYQKGMATGYLNANKMPMRAHENILVFYRALPTYNPQKVKGKAYRKVHNEQTTENYSRAKHNKNENYDGWRMPHDIIKTFQPYVSGQGSFHPQEKPKEILKYLIKTYTNEGETVLDATMGSGSTGVAAIETGRKFIGFELEERFFKIAKERITTAQEYREKVLLRLNNAEMKIVELAIEKLKPYENNPRRNDNAVDAVANSIKEFGFKVPIVVDSDKVIVAGHTRYKAAQKLGFEKVPCVIASDLTAEQIKAFRLVDNKTSELATWVVGDLNSELADLTDFNLENFGIEASKIKSNGNLELAEESTNNDAESERIKVKFRLHKEQARLIRQAMKEIEKDEKFSGDKNMPGDLIHEIVRQWREYQK